MTTQKEALLSALRDGPVCSFYFYHYPGLTHRVAARVHDLKADGFEISARKCDLHHHTSGAVVYELVEDRLFA